MAEDQIEQFRARFRIRAVVDPWNNELTTHEAVQKGILDVERNQYINQAAGDRMSIYEAIQRRLIVQLTPLERIQELRQMGEARQRRMSSFARVRTTDDSPVGEAAAPSRGRLERSYSLRDSRNGGRKQNSVIGCFYGLITFRTKVRTSTFSILSATDTKSGDTWAFNKAKLRGIVDEDAQVYLSSREGESMSFQEALQKGLLNIETTEASEEPEEQVEHFVVYGVMDLLEQRRLTFKEALDNFVLVRHPPIYRDTLNHADLQLDAAIENKLVVAKFVDESSHVLYDRMISEENRIEAERERVLLKYEQK